VLGRQVAGSHEDNSLVMGSSSQPLDGPADKSAATGKRHPEEGARGRAPAIHRLDTPWSQAASTRGPLREGTGVG
jgi:hypothetical protein